MDQVPRPDPKLVRELFDLLIERAPADRADMLAAADLEDGVRRRVAELLEVKVPPRFLGGSAQRSVRRALIPADRSSGQ